MIRVACYSGADNFRVDLCTALDRATEGPEMKRLIADFNRDWPDVTRTRDVLVLAEELAA